MKKNKVQAKNTKELLLFLLVFILSLSVLYAIWYPISFYYSWLRLKGAYILLNSVGLYPSFDTIGIGSQQGEMFAFLPYMALMIATFRKKVRVYWKPILSTFLVIVLIEICGRFFEKLVVLYSANYLFQMASVFFLGTARVAAPFLSWLITLYKEHKYFFGRSEPS
jgi:hypothetical protein